MERERKMLGMARLTDIDQKVFVTICDETKGGMLYEIQLSIGELLEKSLSDFTPQVVDAILVGWLENLRKDERLTIDDVETIDWLLWRWEAEKEEAGK